jgi:hypothetical protein
MTMYYVIRPNPSLLAILQTYDKAYFSETGKARVWKREEELQAASDDEVGIILAKLSFLARQVRLPETESSQAKHSEFLTGLGISPEQQRLREIQSGQLHNELFGKPPQYSLINFDRWWSIERLDPGENVDLTYGLKAAERLELLVRTGNVDVDRWIDKTIEYIRFRESQSDKKSE